ncbi:hypothetical protein M0805_008610 [Coniferiporia weirii]|nr:hypothetical protein M0805_008610 [Coniferiporia weirii]
MSSFAASISATAASSSSTTGPADSSAGAGGGGFSFGPDPNASLVYRFDIALLCVVGVFFLAAVPRAVGRLSNVSEWTRGLILYKGHLNNAPRPPRTSVSTNLRRYDTNPTSPRAFSEQSHTLVRHNVYGDGTKEWNANPDRHASPPMHVRALSSLVHPVSALFSYPVLPGKSVGKLVLMFLYLGGIIFIVFFNDGNPLASPNRLGFIAASQLPVAVALGTKNNLIGMLIGVGYEKLNFLHRWVGIITFCAANVHAIGHIYEWAISGVLSELLHVNFVICGIIGLLGIELLFFVSLGFIRRRVYTLFLAAHIVGLILFFVGISYHQIVCRKYVLVGVALYVFDHFLRLVKTRFATASIEAVPELGLTRIELPGLTTGWRAGQHVRLRVLSAEMGLLGWSVAHPFTIASAGAGDRGLVLMCKKAGSWTNRLYGVASRESWREAERCIPSASSRLKVIIEGPYGGTGNMVMSSYSSVLLVTGGSGVTFALSQAEELVQGIRNGTSALKFLEIVWVTQDKASLGPLIPTFAALSDTVSAIPGVILKISVFCSRASTQPSEVDTGACETLTVNRGRPALPRVLSIMVRLTGALPRASGVAVGVCGPLGLVEDVHKAARGIDSNLRSACGGIEVHEETFGW